MKNLMLMLFAAVLLLVGGATYAQSGPMLGNCPVLPSNNVWNTPVDSLPVDTNSSAYITTIGAARGLHPDFGAGLWDGGPIGIPYNIVPGTQPRVAITFDYADESDPGPYPIPANPAIEGGKDSTGDRHILVVDKDNCVLYETWSTYPQQNGSWSAGSGAVFHLLSNNLRPSGWTSSDAAGLPVLPGLVRYDEVASGEITHAIRFTVPQTRKAFVWPARHYASSLTGSNYPPMGQRFRLKASFDVSTFSTEMQVILRAMKKYGLILADNGSAWYISGAPDERWNNDVLVSQFGRVKGSDFEAVNVSSLMIDPDSGEAHQTGADTDPPTVPSGLTASVLSSSQVGLDWSPSSDNVGVAGYRIYRNDTKVGTALGTSYQDTGLKPGTSYRYRLIAYDAAGNASPASNEVTATTLPPPDTKRPGTPSRLKAVAVSSYEIDLSWKASTDNVGVAGYHIYRNGSRIATAATVSYVDSGLSPATVYTYRVAAFDAAGNVSAMSAAVKSTTWPNPSTKFQAGVRTKIIKSAHLRSDPTASGKAVGVQRSNAVGAVSEGPKYYNRAWWWKVDFETGPDGWLNESNLAAL
jgi:chitodextrinase